MKKAIEAVRRHLDSWNSRNNDLIAQTIAYPFVQYDFDGTMTVHENADDLFDFDALDSFSTNLAAAEVVSSGPSITVVKLSFNWEYPNQNSVGVGNAIWGLELRDGEFFLRWRQFVGWQDDAA